MALTNKRGIFALFDVRVRQNTNYWTNDSVFNFGYFGGGELSSPVAFTSTIDRINYNNDTTTASTRTYLSAPRAYFSGTGNTSYGWFGGSISAVDRIDYSNDTTITSVRGLLSNNRITLASTGNSSFGWFGGGQLFSARLSTVDRIDYSNDTATASVRGSLTAVREYLAATGNTFYGWFGGGWSPGENSRVDRIDYSNDTTTASPRTSLLLAKYGLAATGNSSFGWFGGGYPIGSANSVLRVDYSNDTATPSPRGQLSIGKYQVSATGNGFYGYFSGGFTPPSTTIKVSSVDRIDYSNDTTTTSIRGPLSQGKAYMGTSSAAANALSLYKSNNPVQIRPFGYFGGGATPSSPGSISTIERIDYSNDTVTASVRGSFTYSRDVGAATGNNFYGYHGAGTSTPFFPASIIAIVERIDYSNDTATASQRGPLSVARYALAATGNNSYGWFGGGYNSNAPGPNLYTTVDRIDYSNDNAIASVRGPLSSVRIGVTATGNNSYGWFGGNGFTAPIISTVDRIDYSNDTATSLVRGPLSQSNGLLGATGNSSFGYFGGGRTGSSTVTSTVDRINYSNDTVTASPRGPLAAAKYGLTATGNNSYGWFGGGSFVVGNPRVSTVDRIDYSNDTATASPRGPLSQAKRCLATSPTANALPQ